MRRACFIAALGCLVTACATPVSFAFHGPGETPQLKSELIVVDADVRAALRFDLPQRRIALELTNRTTAPLQVDWRHVTLRLPDGTSVPLRPEEDVGWLAPGALQNLSLVSFVLPLAGSRALALDGQTLVLTMPMVVRYEPRRAQYEVVVSATTGAQR